MTKRALLVMVLVAALTGGVFAQNWYDSYADGIDGSMALINGGIGLGTTGGYSRGIPPISASVDFLLPIDLPITVGVIGTLSTWKYSPYYSSNYSVTYRNIGIGGRGMYHFNFIENLDVYTGLTLGYVIQNATVSGEYGGTYTGSSFFLFGFNIGARYFFTDLLGAYAEIGWSGLQFASIGVSLKF